MGLRSPPIFLAMNADSAPGALLLLLLMLPFWISYIIRTLRLGPTFLGVSGAINQVLMFLGLTERARIRMLYNEGRR